MNIRGLLCVAAIIVSLGMLAAAWYLQQPRQIVARCQSELDSAPDDQVEAAMRRFAELGDAGLQALVESLASKRQTVQEVARRVLADEVDRWQLLPQDAVESRLTALAQDLAASAPHMDRTNRRVAADFATRLILWPRADESQSCPWLAECEAVLATAVAQKRDAGLAAHGSTNSGQIDQASYLQSESGSPAIGSEGMLTDEVHLPGGSLPLEPSPMPEPGGFVEPQVGRPVAVLRTREPGRFHLAPNAHSLDGNDNDDDGQDSDGNSLPGGANRPGRLPSAGRGLRPITTALQSQCRSLDAPGPDDTATWEKLQTRDVMRRLHHADPQIVLAARVELQRRGISGELVDLARRATDPDPKMRQQFAEALPSMSGIDAKPWLIQLSNDDNPQVRASAVTLMATSGDMEMQRRLEQISRDDPDDYVRAQAGKAVGRKARN